MRAVSIKMPVFLACHIGVMRVGKTDRQTPWPALIATRQIVKLAGGLMGNLIIIFQLIGCHANIGARDTAHVVIPPIYAITNLTIIRCPAEIGRVNICGQALFKAMQLIRTNEVHLAHQTGLIAGTAQMMRIGGYRRYKFGRIVIDPGGAGQFARHKTGPTRRTERRGCIGPSKPGGSCRLQL